MPFSFLARLIANGTAEFVYELVKYKIDEEREMNGRPTVFSDSSSADVNESDSRMGSHYSVLHDEYEMQAARDEQMLKEQRKSYVYSDKSGDIGMDDITPIGVMAPKKDGDDDEQFL